MLEFSAAILSRKLPWLKSQAVQEKMMYLGLEFFFPAHASGCLERSEMSWLENETQSSFLKWIPGQRALSTDKRFENEKQHISQCYYHRSENQLSSKRLALTSFVSQHPLQHQSSHLNTMNIHYTSAGFESIFIHCRCTSFLTYIYSVMII